MYSKSLFLSNFTFGKNIFFMCKIYLKTTNILNVPIHTYMDEFTFIVNNKKFKTTRLIADLISPTISKFHLIDPTNSR